MATDDITTLISGLQVDDPKLYQALMTIQRRVFLVEKELRPLTRQTAEIAVAEQTITSPASFTYTIFSIGVRLHWTAVSGAAQYEIRKGTDWNTASFVLRTTSISEDDSGVISAVLDPMLVGSYTFLIKAITSSGVYSPTPTSLLVTIPPIPAPILTKQVIDNNVLLTWTTPISAFAIDYYILRRGESDIGHVRGNFTTYFEIIAGTYEYSIAAVDIVGNEGERGRVNVTLTIPADFVLEATRESSLGAYVHDPTHFVYLSVLSLQGDVNYRYAVQVGFENEPTHFYFGELVVTSTLSNVLLMPGPKLLACWATETFQNHFTSRSWLSPKNQVDAGYPIYIQPSALTGYFEEIYDYGGLFENNIVTITWGQNNLTPESVGIVVKMAVSTDGVNYPAYTTGASQFFQSLRFLKFKLEFTGVNDKALIEVFSLVINLNIKKEMDSGVVTADKDDVGGTQVNFTKPFKDIDSITLAVDALEPVVAIYDFTDVPNPTGFKVLAFDTTGNRITYPVSWKARGVI